MNIDKRRYYFLGILIFFTSILIYCTIVFNSNTLVVYASSSNDNVVKYSTDGGETYSDVVDLTTAYNAVQEGDDQDLYIIKVQEDFTFNSWSITTGSFSFDLNGKIVTGPISTWSIYGGNVTFLDSSSEKTGTLITSTFCQINTGCVITIRSGNFINTRINGSGSNFRLNGGDLFIYDGYFSSNTTGTIGQNIYVASGHAEIYGGKFYAVSDFSAPMIVAGVNNLSRIYGGYFKAYFGSELATNTKNYFSSVVFNNGYFISSEVIAEGDFAGYYAYGAIQYTITLQENGGVDLDNIIYDVTMTTITLPIPTKQYYSFMRWEITIVENSSYGWYVGSTYISTNTSILIGQKYGSFTLEAIWTPLTYTVSFLTYGGTNNDQNISYYTIENNSFTLYEPVKSGYLFIGWFLYESNKYYDVNLLEYSSLNDDNLNITNNITSVEDQSGNKIFSAKWLALPSVSLKYGDTLSNVTLPNGWSWESPTTVVSSIGNSTFNMVYTIVSTTKTVEVQINVAKLSITKPTANTNIFTYNGSEQTYTITTNSNYTIANNIKTDAGSQNVTVSLNDKTNYQWSNGTTDDLTFSFVINKAMPIITSNPTFPSVVWGRNLGTANLSNGQASVSGSFVWENEDDTFDSCGTVAKNCLFNPTDSNNYENVTISLNIDIIPIIVVFENYDYSILSTQNIQYDTSVTPPQSPTKPATQQYTYTFSGWDSEVPTTITQNTIFVAQYESNTRYYTIILENDLGEVIQSLQVEFEEINDDISLIPQKESTNEHTYIFIGWQTSTDEATGFIIKIAQFEELDTTDSLWILWTLIIFLIIAGAIAGAIWLLMFKKQTIKYMLNGKVVTKLQYKFNELLEIPHDLENYEWFIDEKETTLFMQHKMKLKSLVLYGKSKNIK